MGSGSRPADAREQPRPGQRGAARRPRRLRRDRPRRAELGVLRSDRRDPEAPRRHRDDARPVGQSGRGLRNARGRAARPHLELHARAGLGDGRGVPPARGIGPDHVRADDRGLLDLHREPGHRAGHVRDVRGGGPPPLRRGAGGPARRHRGPRGDGGRAAAGGDDERRDGARRGSRPRAHRETPADPLSRRARNPSRRGDRPGPRGAGRPRGDLDRRRSQRRRPPRAADRARDPSRRRDRPDLGARRARRLRPPRERSSRAPAAAPGGSRRLHRPFVRDDGRSHARAARAAAARGRGLRLRQQPARPGEEGGRRGRVPGRRLRAALHPAPLLRGEGPLPLGGALGGAGGHPHDRPRAPRALSGGRRPSAMARSRRPVASPSRVCRHGSAGSAMESDTARACSSTSWCARARSAVPS